MDLYISEEEAKDLGPDELLRRLGTSLQGLSEEEAGARLEKVGENALPSEERSVLWMLFGFFWGPIPWMIEVAAILSLLVGHFADFYVILGLLIFNALIGFWEEHKAQNALDALKKGLALKAKVKRGGSWGVIDSVNLVPGDLVRIRLGDIIPADVSLTEGDYVSVDQSALTGESLPVTKRVGGFGYSGSIVKKGEMEAVVTATGAKSFLGKTAQLVAKAGALSHFQQAVMRIGDFLIFVAIALAILLTSVELYRGEPILEVLQFILILVIASIPVAMPAVLSVTMALGALKLSKQKAIVSHLQAIEELAGIDVLCSDKTGTLTQNKLTLGDPIPFEGAKDLILSAAIASRAEDQDPIDLAIIGSLPDASILKDYPQSEFIPFDPASKRSEATVKGVSYSKGAPQVILDLCQLEGEPKEQMMKKIEELAGRGYRTLAVARKERKGWAFQGLLPLYDPPRTDSKETIEKAKEHGLSVKMVTGDHTAIAKELAAMLGLGRNIHPAGEFFGAKEERLTASQGEQIERADGFAEVLPEHKYQIVKALQEMKHQVIMTGDGVNDAPALKQADCGIAVQGATDAARAAAALILTNPGLSVIIKAIEEARCIFERMISYTIYRIAMTFDIMIFVVLTMLFIPDIKGVPFQPLSAIMIVLLALLDDIPIMTIAYDNTKVNSGPVRWRMAPIFIVATVLGLTAVLETFGLLVLGVNWLDIDPKHLQSMLFLQLVLGGHLMLFLTRTRGAFFKPPFPSPILFLAILGTQIFAALMCFFGLLVPELPWELIGLVWLYNIAWMFVQDGVKLLTYGIVEGKFSHHKKLLKRTNE